METTIKTRKTVASSIHDFSRVTCHTLGIICNVTHMTHDERVKCVPRRDAFYIIRVSCDNVALRIT